MPAANAGDGQGRSGLSEVAAIDKTAVLQAGGVFLPPVPSNDDPAVPTEFII